VVARLVLGGRFKLIRHLGGGGMSEVFLAEQVSLKRLVALKVLKRDLGAQPRMKERFRSEAQLLSTVDHPSVVRVIDFESNPSEGTVLVLEFAEGETLEQALRPGPFEPARGVRVLFQLAEGLAAIHERGIVHRDIKPQNVVLSQSARGEQARLLDFGIARLLELSESADATPAPIGGDPFMSQPGQAVGTPAYVSPEQAMAASTTAASDVYSFGVLAFRLLTGRLPFEGPTTRDYLEQHVSTKPPTLESVAPHLAVVSELCRLVMRCLEKQPEARFGDGLALAEALRRCLPSSQIPLTTQTRHMLNAVTSQTLTAVQGSVSSLGQRSRQGARQVRRLARQLDRSTRRSLAVTVLLTALVPTAWAVWPPSAVERAQALLEAPERNQGAAALALIDASLPQATRGDLVRLWPLKAAALHQVGRVADAHALIRSMPYQVLFVAPAPLLEALAEDVADAEGDPEVEEWLQLLPARARDPVLAALAAGPLSRKQWGALRWLDRAGRATAPELAERYAACLTSLSCGVREKAARRLGELGERRAIEALRELSETPKDEGPTGRSNCGQDEAAEAVRALKKKAEPGGKGL
jgi:serine/threonine protein kinase